MPVSVVCESTANAVNAAIRESLGNGYGAASATDDTKVGNSMSSGADDCLQSKIASSAKRVLLSKIDYEEVSNYSQQVLDTFKSKYIILKPTSKNGNNDNGRASPATYNNTSATCNINGTSSNHNDTHGKSSVTSSHNGNNNNNNNNNNSPLSKRSNVNELPHPKRVLYPRENVRIGWKNSSRKWQVGAGMYNLGNTCYLNSTLQALFHVPSLANWLMSDSTHYDKCDMGEGGGCIICAMTKTLRESQCSSSAVRPVHVYSKLKSICKHMVMGRQEDAHEFLRYLVEAMEKAYLVRIRNYKELEQYSKETTPLNQILGGYLKSAVRCLACGHVSVTFQHFQDLLLDIRKADSIEEALDGYFSCERLEDMGYKCESCKKKVSATKQFSLERAPIALCIQLKRFSMMGAKINKHITIKPRLDLTKFITHKNIGEQLTYKLVAMVTHLGASQHCGHYTAIGLTESGTYYNFDDSNVRPISVQNVCNTNAYIIFYEMDNAPIREISCTQVSSAEAKENYQKINGYVLNTNGGSTIERMIGPQLPPTSLNSYNSNLNAHKSTPFGSTNGSKLNGNNNNNNNNNNKHQNGSVASNNSKLITHFKNNNNSSGSSSHGVKSSVSSSITTATATSSSHNDNTNNTNKTSTQNSLLMGAGKFQESSNAKFILGSTSNKGKIATISNGNENSSYWSTDNEDEVTSSTQNTPRDLNASSSNDYKSSLPSMPRIGDEGKFTPNVMNGQQHYNNNNNNNNNTKRNGAIPTSSTAIKSPLKSLVPYESETDDESVSTDSKGNKCTTSAYSAKNSLKRRSSFSNSSEDEFVNEEPTNGIKIKKAATTTTTSQTTAKQLSGINNNSSTITSSKGNSQQSKTTHKKTDAIDEIFNSHKRNSNKNNVNHNNNTTHTATITTTSDVAATNTPTKNKPARTQSQQHLVSSTTYTYDLDDDDYAADEFGVDTTQSTFKRSHSTPPSPPVIKTKTGYWQVTSLQPKTNAENTTITTNGNKNNNRHTTEEKMHKNHNNPFANRSSEANMMNGGNNARHKTYSGGNGYQQNTVSDSTVNELLKQTHRGYGAPVLSWNGQPTDIEREINNEMREQRQRDWEDEEEIEMDRGHQKKVKQPKETYRNQMPGYNPFQEHENQRRWNKNGSNGYHHGYHRFHNGYVRNQFQRNKFKFQRYNHKFSRANQRNNSNNNNNNNNNNNSNNNSNNGLYSRRSDS